MTQYKPSGVLFTVDPGKKKSQNHPDYTGNLELSREVIIDLHNQIASEPNADRGTCRIGGWNQTSKSGMPFISILASKEWRREDQQATAPARKQAPQPQEDDDIDIPF